MNEQTRRRLEEMAEENCRKFNRSILPGVENILGVRLPKLRKMAGELARQGWEQALEGEDFYYEERMLRGILIAQAPMPAEAKIKALREFVPQIDSWAVCDSFCAGLKQFVQENFEQTLELVVPYLESEREFEVRFGIVTLLDYFVLPETIDRVFELLAKARRPGYYARAALAWALSLCYVKFPEKTRDYLKRQDLDDFTYRKTLQKIRESRRVSARDKAALASLKRKADREKDRADPDRKK